jgi:hypothetical protein
MNCNIAHHVKTIATAASVIFILAACTQIPMSEPDYGDYVSCGGSGSLFRTIGQTRACMDSRQAARRQVEIEAGQRAWLEEKRRQAQVEELEKIVRQNPWSEPSPPDREAAKREIEAFKKTEDARQEFCGQNRGQIRIGMSFDQLRQCWGRFGLFRLNGQVNRDDGVAFIYEILFDTSGGLANEIGVSAIYFIDGKVVGWAR